MFKRIRENLIESDEGFSVEVTGRVGLRYREADKVLDVDSEVGEHPYMVIYGDSLKRWEPPHEDDLLDDRKRSQIIENIRRAFQSQGLDIGVIYPSLPRP
ncbi:MAG: Imm74 family immunity protein [Chloroflexi bacterium]|nr:Imm74 family immunity protein [Chloroflexota bacterium]